MKVLTEAAQEDRDDYERDLRTHSCTCHLSPPCHMCIHPGNPLNQDEDEACWEEDDGDGN